MKQVQAHLLNGEGRAALARLASLCRAHPDRVAAAAQPTVELLRRANDAFRARGVHEFMDGMDAALPSEICDAVRSALGPAFERTRVWEERLHEMTRERLGREARGWLVTRRVDDAARAGLALFRRARDERERREYPVFFGRALGGMRRDADRARKVFEVMAKEADEDAALADGIARAKEAFDAVAEEVASNEYERDNQAWLQQFNEAVLSLRASLPGPNATGAPDDAEQATFDEELSALFRAGLLHERDDDLLDALIVVAEYCPTDPARIQNAAGVEDRMFIQLGPRARIVAARAIAALGERARWREAVDAVAEADRTHDRIEILAAVMGGARRAEFTPWLLDALRRGKDTREAERLIEALGRIGDPQALDALLDRLKRAVRKMRDPAHEREAYTLITSLGRLGRARGLDPERRGRIVKQIVETVGDADRQLAFHVAFEMFSVRIEQLPSDLRAWAARKTVEAMWGRSAQVVTGRDGAVFAWREPMIATLKRLGPEALDDILAAAEKYATQYGVAMGALAEVLQVLGDERAVGLLASMIHCAFLHDEDDEAPEQLREQVVDVANEQVRDLDRDDLIHTLLYTVKKIGAETGLSVVLDVADQVQAGRLRSPGDQTTGLLVEAKLKSGRLGESAQARVAHDMDAAAFKQALDEANGGWFVSRAKRIGALARLSRTQRVEAVGVFLNALGDKDKMVAASAHTALTSFVHPLPDETAFAAFLNALFAHPGRLKGRTLDAVLEFLRNECPRNAPYDRVFERQVAVAIENEALADRLREALRTPIDAGKEDGGGAEESEPERSDFDARRAYLQARREWIRAGKQGPEPRMPE